MERPWGSQQRRLIEVACAVLALLAYCLGASFVLRTRGNQLFTELPLLIFSYALLRSVIRERQYAWAIATGPLLWAYLCHDLSLVYLGRVPDWVDIELVPLLFSVLPARLLVPGVALTAAPFLAIAARLRRPSRIGVGLWFAALTLLLALMGSPGRVSRVLAWPIAAEAWSEARNVRYHGRLYMALLREAKRRANAAALREHPSRAAGGRVFSAAVRAQLGKRNLHLVVLESFMDPRRFTTLTWNRSPFSDAFTALFGEPSVAISPAFGSGTSRAEFEILCGVPAIRMLGEEFNAFTGTKTHCLPTLLAEAGMHAVVSYPWKPDFYNAANAYPGLGFETVLFGDRWSPPGARSIDVSSTPGRYLFDGDLYEQNRVMLGALAGPVFNYILTMYGHIPFELDPARHATVLSSRPSHPNFEVMANQVYHRSEAMAQWVADMVERDPDCLIVLLADHLPPIGAGTSEYRAQGISRDKVFENVALVVDRGEVVRMPVLHHYEYFAWILDRLTDGAYCSQRTCYPQDPDAYLQTYKSILGRATRSR